MFFLSPVPCVSPFDDPSVLFFFAQRGDWFNEHVPPICFASLNGGIGLMSVCSLNFSKLAPGNGAQDNKRLLSRNNRLRQRSVRRIMGKVLFAGKKSYER